MQWRRWLVLMGSIVFLMGCVDSKMLARLSQPHVKVDNPMAWACGERVKLPLEQGGMMGGGVTECTRCLNHTSQGQRLSVRDTPLLLAPGDSFYTCDNGRVSVGDGEVRIGQGSTRR